jgi:hypothetical protein
MNATRNMFIGTMHAPQPGYGHSLADWWDTAFGAGEGEFRAWGDAAREANDHETIDELLHKYRADGTGAEH